MLDALLLDVRYCLRSLRHSPGFSAVVVLTLMLAVGANTALFSVLNALLMRKLPVREPDRLVVLSLRDPRSDQLRFVYFDTFNAFLARQRAFDAVAPYSGGGLFRTDVPSGQIDAAVETATPESYRLLGVRAVVGRLISSEDAPSLTQGAPVAVISYRFWQRHFNGDSGVLGRPLTVSGVPLTIVGVTEPAFQGLQVDGGADIGVPLAMMRQFGGDLRRPHRARNAIGRLRAGVTLEQARAELRASWPEVQRTAMPAGLPLSEQQDLQHARIDVESFATGFSSLRTQYAQPLEILVAGAALLLGIGCINLSGLLLSRLAARRQQMAIRAALGASRARLIQICAIESVLLSASGAAAALPLAWWTTHAIRALLWASPMPMAMSMAPDARVFAVAAAVALVAALLIGALPAWMAADHHRHPSGTPVRTSVAGRSGRALVVAQVALSLTLLSCAGLLVRTLANLRANDARLPARRLLFTRLWLEPTDRRPHDDASYYSTLVDELSRLPGVEAVGLSMYFPAYLKIAVPPDAVGRADAADRSGDVQAQTEIVSPRFFETVGVSRLQGRDFSWSDTAAGEPVAMVNATLARALNPSGDAIGLRVRTGADDAHRAIEIVGVVDDAAVGDIRRPHVGILFRPLLQEPQRAQVPIVNLRALGDPRPYGEKMTAIVASHGRHFVRGRLLSTLDEQIDQVLLQERLLAGLSSFFGGLAVLLACVGVFGLLAHAVVRRTREIGIRIAVGATRLSIVRMVVVEAAALVAAGLALGVPGALAAGRLVQSLLYGVGPHDVVTIGAAAGAFFLAGTCAGLWPALRAASTDPLAALRHE
jgi:predicted permease